MENIHVTPKEVPEQTPEIVTESKRKIEPKGKRDRVNVVLLAITFLIIAFNTAFVLFHHSTGLISFSFHIVILLSISGMMISYYYWFQKDKIFEHKSILLLSCFLLLGLIPSVYLAKDYPYLMPLLLIVMLLATVFSQEIAFMYGMGSVLYISGTGFLVLQESLVYFMMVLLVHQLLPYIRKRHNIIYIALMNMIAFGLFILFVSFAEKGDFNQISWLDVIYGMANGLVSVIFFMGSLPLWESAFDVLTPNKLMELANPNNEILQKLLLDAPGTYHHSLMVANLAEKAAIDLQLDALLVRTAGMYHDIGKLKNPQYFVENQSGSNPHDLLPPIESAQIIIDHVTEGLRLAKKYRLPKPIMAFIREHHGDRSVYYFYQKALQEDPHTDIKNFQYPYPKPHSKESAILMMADVSEATVKSIPEQERTLEKIAQTIDQVTAYLIVDNQLVESGLTFKEFDRAKESFVSVYRGLYHERISYGSR